MKHPIKKSSFNTALLAISLFLFLSANNLSAQEKGIHFFKGTWEELLAESKKQDKPIFVDAYAVWCGPCRWMDANVFPQEEIGEFYNKHFINYKFDMEKGEGPNFAQNYQVRAYPTLLYVDHDGSVKYRTMGGKTVEMLLDEGQKALAAFK